VACPSKAEPTTCGRLIALGALGALALALVTTFTASARGESFVRRLAERALERGVRQEARGDIAQALTSYDESVRTASS
jgi:hypothetical protein